MKYVDKLELSEKVEFPQTSITTYYTQIGLYRTVPTKQLNHKSLLAKASFLSNRHSLFAVSIVS